MFGEPPLPSAFRALLSVVNRAAAALERVGVTPVSLDEADLIGAARQATGLSDFGDDRFRVPFRVLLRALTTEARLTCIGRIVARGDIVALLTSRLRLEADRVRHPGIADEQVRRPLFIVGLPRTGSTLLHQLLAQDPAARVARAWEVMEPSPPPERGHYHTDPRIARAAWRLRWFDRLAPEFKKVHPLGAELPLECIAIMSASFLSPRFHTTYHVPTYQAWLADADLGPAYDFHRRFLQHLQWRMPAGHWVLKAPSHVFGFEALFRTYPDALVVQTHRDPLRVLGSVASLTWTLQGAFTDHLDVEEIGGEVTERWLTGLERAVEARLDPRLGQRFFDVRYDELVQDAMVIVRRIYDRFGMTLSAEAEARMRAFLASHPRDRHGPHHYELPTFGLDPVALAHRFKSYYERFGIDPEPVADG
jgi:Sulfotransferase family